MAAVQSDAEYHPPKDAAEVIAFLGVPPACRAAVEKLPVVGILLSACEAAKDTWKGHEEIKHEIECLEDCCKLSLRKLLPTIKADEDIEVLQKWLEKAELKLEEHKLFDKGVAPANYADDIRHISGRIDSVATAIVRVEVGIQEIQTEMATDSDRHRGTHTSDIATTSPPPGPDVTSDREAVEWLALAVSSVQAKAAAVVHGKRHSAKDCTAMALRLCPQHARAWLMLGYCGGGFINNVDYTQVECYARALKLKPDYAEAWTNLGFQGGGRVADKDYTEAECYAR
eukprot:5997582-Amphidinium_carterae.1